MKLNPQPTNHLVDCVEDYRNPGIFSFFDGNEMEGHNFITQIKAPNLNVEPLFDYENKLWNWISVSKETLYHREWWKKHLKMK